jgi:hypothetical protein
MNIVSTYNKFSRHIFIQFVTRNMFERSSHIYAILIKDSRRSYIPLSLGNKFSAVTTIINNLMSINSQDYLSVYLVKIV